MKRSVLDRRTGTFLLGEPFVKVNWASGLDQNGRPIQTRQPAGAATYPGNQGGTNWYPPSYSPRTGLFYVPTWDNYSSRSAKYPAGEWVEGKRYTGSTPPANMDVPAGGGRQRASPTAVSSAACSSTKRPVMP